VLAQGLHRRLKFQAHKLTGAPANNSITNERLIMLRDTPALQTALVRQFLLNQRDIYTFTNISVSYAQQMKKKKGTMVPVKMVAVKCEHDGEIITLEEKPSGGVDWSNWLNHHLLGAKVKCQVWKVLYDRNRAVWNILPPAFRSAVRKNLHF